MSPRTAAHRWSPEVKFRFGRYLEWTGGRPVFDAPLHPK
jgi:hypothetical protein